MQIARNRSFGISDNAYSQVEYLQTNGKQCIDTGILGTYGMHIKFKFKFDELPSEWKTLACCLNESVSYPPVRNYISKSPWNYFGYGIYDSCSEYSYQSLNTTTKYEIEFNSYSYDYSGKNCFLKVNGTTCFNYSKTYTQPAQYVENIWIFDLPIHIGCPVGKLYYFKVYDKNDNLLRDMIPVKKSDGTYCFFDNISGQFFYNQGTEPFSGGGKSKLKRLLKCYFPNEYREVA